MPTRQLRSPTRQVEQASRDLAEHGYALLADILTEPQLESMSERFEEQAVAEARARGENPSIDDPRLFVVVSGLLNKGKVWQQCIDPSSTLHQVIDRILRPSTSERGAQRLNLEQSFVLSALSAMLKRKEADHALGDGPKAHHSLIFHVDQGQIPHYIDFPILLNTFTALTDYTEGNGCTMVVPRSHTSPPPDWDQYSGEGAVAIEMPAGTTLIVEGRTWHAAGLNTDGSLRASIFALYCTPWLKQTWNFPMNLRQDVLDELSDDQLKLLGFDTLWQSEYGAFSGPNTSSRRWGDPMSPPRHSRLESCISVSQAVFQILRHSQCQNARVHSTSLFD